MNRKAVINSAKLHQLLKASNLSITTSTLLAVFLAYMLRDVIPVADIVVWLSLIALVAISRALLAFLFKKYPTEDHAVLRSRLVKFRIGVIFAGITWGLAGFWLFPVANSEHQMFLVFMLVGLMAGGIVSYSSDIVSSVSFCTLVITPIAIRLLLAGETLSISMGAAMILYLSFIIFSLHNISKSIIDNIALRIEASGREEALRISEERYRLIYNNSPLPMWVIDASSLRFLDVNERAIEHYGYTREEFNSMTLRDIRPVEDMSGLEKIISNMRDGKIVGELRHKKKNGSYINVAINSISINYAGIPARIGIVRDITERILAEKNERRMSRAFQLLSRCGSTLVHASDEQSLLKEICKQIVEVGGYSMAWVGYAEKDKYKSVRPVAWVGHEQGYLSEAKITWADTERGNGPVGTTIRTGVKSIIQDFHQHPHTAPWRELALERDYNSCISLPLVINNYVVGALTIYSVDHYAYIQEEVELLEVLANDLSFGINALRTEAKHRKTRLDLKLESEKNLALLRNASDGIHIFDINGNIIEVSDSFCSMLGYKRHELHGMNVSDWDVKIPYEQIMFDIRNQFTKKSRNQFETQHKRKDGTILDVEISSFPLELDGKPVLFNSSRDITERKKLEYEMLETSQLLRELSEKSRLMIEEERKHIAREVHDELGQILTALRMDVELIDMRFGEINADLSNKTKDMTDLLDQSVRCLRGIVSNLRPTSLDSGIVSAIEWLCNEFSSRTGNSYVLSATGEFVNVDEDCTMATFRMIQELLNNSARHAAASKVEVILVRQPNSLLLQVSDNGKGFETDIQNNKKSFGLLGIRERVFTLGGGLNVTSSKDYGTTVTITVPCKPKEISNDTIDNSR